MKANINILCIIFLTLATGIRAQETDVSSLLDSTRHRLLHIESYDVDATLQVDIDFVNMPDKKARIHFTAPDKLDIESDGFLMIPKVGLKPMIRQLDLDRYHAMLIDEDYVHDDSCFVIKLIPKRANSKIVLSTLWIRKDDYFILGWEVFMKKSGNMMVDFYYDDEVLPGRIVFSFELSKMNIPLKYFGSEVEIDDAGLKSGEVQQGKVSILFENYHIVYSNK